MLTLLSLALINADAATAAASNSRPNILFVFCDDLGYGDLACHGQPRVISPATDRLAREGTDFTQFTVASGVCSPSRVAVMTGQYPARHRVHGHFAREDENAVRGMPNYLDPAAPLVTRLLQQSGYAVGHYGKWHLSGGGRDGYPNPTRYGIDDARVWTGPGPHPFEGLPGLSGRTRPQGEFEYAVNLSPAATTHAERFVREHADQPWYVNLWLHETHHLVAATDEEKAPYADVPEPQRTYLANVTRADRCLGRMLSLLDELGLASNPLVVFSSDNGPEDANRSRVASVGETGGRRGRKRSLYLGGVNVPCLIRWPGQVPAGRVDSETLLSAVDLLPTFLAAAGVEPPADYESDGQNMLDALRGEPVERRRPLFWQWNAAQSRDAKNWPAAGIRRGRYALVTDGERTELFDVVADVAQQVNLSSDQPKLTSELLAEIRVWERSLPEGPKASVVDARRRRQRTPTPKQTPKQTPKPTQMAEPMARPPGKKIDRAVAFARRDADGNGRLTLEEYLAHFAPSTGGEERFANFDRNSDGVVTPAEFGVPAAE